MKDKRLRFWSIALGITLAIRFFLPSQWVEKGYSRGFYVAYRFVWERLTGWLPVPLFVVFWLGVTAFLGWHLVRLFRKGALPYSLSFWAKMGLFLKNILILCLILATTFFWVWGFNYNRTPFYRQIGMVKNVPLDSLILKTELDTLPNFLLSLRNSIKSPPPSTSTDFEPKMLNLVRFCSDSFRRAQFGAIAAQNARANAMNRYKNAPD